MGHSSVDVNLDHNGHLFPELDAGIAEGLDETFQASLNRPGGRSDTAEDTARRQRGVWRGPDDSEGHSEEGPSPAHSY
ncbi:MAG: hypothetical protein LC808_32555 [Actinobacteria bacterium]|nr:hypothetical protein [Actinomycetota bacterium]